MSSGSPQTLNGKGTRCVATVSINNVAAKRNRQEDLDAEHKTCGNSALRKSITGLIEENVAEQFIVDCVLMLRILTVCHSDADSTGTAVCRVYCDWLAD